MGSEVRNNVQVNYVIASNTARNIATAPHFSTSHEFKLVDKNKFHVKCCEVFGNDFQRADSDQLWDTILGNYPDSGLSGIHPHVHYLTEASCHTILKHLHQFEESGLDYQKLPLGFFTVRNPEGNGGRDVLHYHEYVGSNDSLNNPLVIKLTNKAECSEALKPTYEFDGAKQAWYAYLIAMANHKTPYRPCTQTQLDEAFIHFANKVESSNLSFYDIELDEPPTANPITFLGRMEGILFQRHLKPDDKKTQWHAIMQLPLARSYDAIRAITDHMFGKTPCGFVLPEMAFSRHDVVDDDDTYQGYKTILNAKSISDHGLSAEEVIRNFYRFIAYQPNRNSIPFYQNAIQAIPTNDPLMLDLLLPLLASATTGSNHAAASHEDEAQELTIWTETCNLIHNIENASLITRTLAAQSPGQLKREFLSHFTRLTHSPNIMFLGLMTQHCFEYIKGLSIFSNLRPLEQLSNKLDGCVTIHANHFYHGSKFYLGSAKPSGSKSPVQLYTELAYEISCLGGDSENDTFLHFVRAIIPLLSTFHIENLDQFNAIKQESIPSHRALAFFTLIYKKAARPIPYELLEPLLEDLKKAETAELSSSSNMELEYLSIFQKSTSTYFENGFFRNLRRQIEDAKNGLNPHQIELLKVYPFQTDDFDRIVIIESALVRTLPHTTDQTLINLNEQFMTLSTILMPSEFSEFLERLTTLRACMPTDTETLSFLLQHIIDRKSLDGFNLIFLRNTREKINDVMLIKRIIVFVELERYISSKSWEKINPILLQEVLATLILRQSMSAVGQSQANSELIVTINKLAVLLELHPHAQELVIQLVHHYAANDGSGIELAQLLENLTNTLPPGSDETALDNMSVFYALISQYKAQSLEFVTLLKQLQTLNSADQRFFLILISRLQSNEKSIEGLGELITKCEDISILERLKTYAAHPPYADIQTLNYWLSLSEEEAASIHRSFCLSPYGERYPEYQFNLKQYFRQRHKFQGVSNDVFTPIVGQLLDKHLKVNRRKSPGQLVEIIEKFRDKRDLSTVDWVILLPAVIELLARNAHQSNAKNPSGLCSQELNTTQVMTAYAMLTSGQTIERIMNQIDTGEGKARLMAILCACQALQGKTVDLMTSNLMLAERDWFTYQSFFTALNIPSGLINLNTPPQLYRKKGVNVSDNATLILLGNKSDIDRTPLDYRADSREDRTLLIDEADKFVHDKSNHAFNYASYSELLSQFTWIYPHLVRFMLKKNRESVDEMEINDALEADFLNDLKLHDYDPLHKAILAHLRKHSPKQIKVWLNSALIAIHSKKGEDYIVTGSHDDALFPVKNKDGMTCYTRKVLVIDNGRPMEGSEFSNGVHQCICALENISAKKEAFLILPENQTQRTQYAGPMLDSYGNIFGLSGSTRPEAPMKHPEVNLQKWQYMITPREKTLVRIDRPILAAKDASQHLEFIKRDILEALKKGEPYLLICRNDKESHFYMKLLSENEALYEQVARWQHVHGLTSPEDERTAVKMAGLAGHLTIASAGMFSRGIDIRSQNLRVGATYVMTQEDEIQTRGRTGRFGQPGEYRMIINLQDENCPIDGLTSNIERRVRQKQQQMAIDASLEEKTATLYGKFLEEIHQEFIQQFDATLKAQPMDKVTFLRKWQDFLEDLQKDWQLKRSEIKIALDNENLEHFKDLFSDFTACWCEKMRANLGVNSDFAKAKATDELCNAYYTSVRSHRGFFAEQSKQHPIKVKWCYDKADDGQATIYQMPFAKLIATLSGERPLFADFIAWQEGRGELFPDMMAVFRGERLPFANLIAFIQFVCEWIVSYFTSPETSEDPEMRLPLDDSDGISDQVILPDGENMLLNGHSPSL